MRTFLRGRLDTILAIVFATTGCVTAWPASAAAADELPRYKFKVGQEIVYHETVEPEHWDFTSLLAKSHNEWTFKVIRENNDGGWRVVFREQQVTTNYLGNSGEQTVANGYFDIFPDGRIVENRTIRFRAGPAFFLPLLPPDKQSLTRWQLHPAFDDMTALLTAPPVAPSGNADWTFVEKLETPRDAVNLMSRERRYIFDGERGLIRQLGITAKRGWPKEAAYQSHVELVDVKQLGTEDTKALDNDMEHYVAALTAYDRIMERVQLDYLRPGGSLDEAASILNHLEPELHTPFAQKLLADLLRQHRADRDYSLDDAKRFGELIDQPSPGWETVDLDGRPHALKDYRGKIVVLVFWFRGCPWCIREMPQLKQLADDFKDQPVAVLGINTDSDVSNARFVSDKLELNYPTLKNGNGDEAISEKYHVHGYPTLVLIDQKGVVRDFHGYSTTLRDDMERKIRELLAAPKE